MRTASELLAMLSGTVRRWLGHFFVLGTWFLLGALALTLASYGSVMIGGRQRFWATLVFVLGAVAQLLCTIMAIHSLRQTVRLPAAPQESATDIRGQLRASERTVEVLVGSMGAFIGVYAVWGLVETWLNRLVRLNVELKRPGDWSVSFTLDQIWFYTALALGAFALRWAVTAATRNLRSPWWRTPTLLLEGLWEFASFFMFLSLLGLGTEWLSTREVWLWCVRAWHGLVDWLPSWRVLGAALPDVVQGGAEWIVTVFAPTVWNDVLFPLAWLALVATVFGWREGVEEVTTHNPLEKAVHWAATDARGKWLPVARALKLVWGAGPRVLGVLVLCAAALDVLRRAIAAGIAYGLGPLDAAETLVTRPLTELFVGLVCDTLMVALYVTALDRALRAGREHEAAERADAARDQETGRITTTLPPRVNPLVENSMRAPSTRS